jgi:hypothetical protein
MVDTSDSKLIAARIRTIAKQIHALASAQPEWSIIRAVVDNLCDHLGLVAGNVYANARTADLEAALVTQIDRPGNRLEKKMRKPVPQKRALSSKGKIKAAVVVVRKKSRKPKAAAPAPAPAR